MIVTYILALTTCLLIWGWAKYRVYKAAKKSDCPDIYEIERRVACFKAIRPMCVICLLPLFGILTCLVPNVKIVHGISNVEHIYVPFCYKGQYCALGTTYIVNDSAFDLVLYPTRYYNGRFSLLQFSSKEHQYIPQGKMMALNNGIDNYFEYPSQNFIPDMSQGEKIVWTLDTRQGAEEGIRRREQAIEHGNTFIIKNFNEIINRK